MVIVFFDVEYTAWEGSQQRGWSEPWEFREIVQFGAAKVKLPGSGVPIRLFQRLVRPVRNPQLSDYFMALTGIRQVEVDRDGTDLPSALADFLAFCDGSEAICSNGDDAVVVAANMALLGLSAPEALSRAVDIGRLVSLRLGGNGRHISTCDLPARLRLDLHEPPHHALGDAKALAASVAALSDRDPSFLGALVDALQVGGPVAPA